MRRYCGALTENSSMQTNERQPTEEGRELSVADSDADHGGLTHMGHELTRGEIDRSALRTGFRAGDDLAGERAIANAANGEQESKGK
jgi:hypothetical protein